MGNCCPKLVGGGAESNVVDEVTKNNSVELVERGAESNVVAEVTKNNGVELVERGAESNVVDEVTKNNSVEHEPVKTLPLPTTKPQDGNSVIPAEDKHPGNSVIPVEDEHPGNSVIPAEDKHPGNSVIPVEDEHPEMKKCTNGNVLEDSTLLTYWICNGCNCAHDTMWQRNDGITVRKLSLYISDYLVWDLPSDAKRYSCQACKYDLCEICYKAKGKTHRVVNTSGAFPDYCMKRPVAIPVTKQTLHGMDVYTDDWLCNQCKKRPDMDTKILWKCCMCSYRMCNECLEVD